MGPPEYMAVKARQSTKNENFFFKKKDLLQYGKGVLVEGNVLGLYMIESAVKLIICYILCFTVAGILMGSSLM